MDREKEGLGIFIRSQLSESVFNFENAEMLESFARALENDKAFYDSLTKFIVSYLDGYSVSKVVGI